jgi:hypothetical protein
MPLTNVCPTTGLNRRDSSALCMPALVELAPRDRGPRENIAEGRLFLVWGSGDTGLLKTLTEGCDVCGDDRVIETLLQLDIRRRLEPAASCATIALLFRGRAILSAAPAPGRLQSAWIPFPGGPLQPRDFTIVLSSASRNALAGARFVVAAQQPALSGLEIAVNERVPCEIRDLDRIQSCRTAGTRWAPLLAMDGDWAVGGLAALREINRWRRAWTSPSPALAE